MKITVEDLRKAGQEAYKKDGAVYVIEESGEPKIIVNSAGFNAVNACNHIIKHLTVEEIEYNYCIYAMEQMRLDKFCKMVNTRYELL